MTLVRLAVFAVLATLAATGCSSKPAEERAPPAEPRPVEVKPAEPVKPTNTANRAATSDLPGDFPRECLAYAELIDKLKKCDQLSAMRDGLTQAFVDLKSAWSTVPTDQRAQVTAQCRTQADSLRNAAAAACGW